MDTTVMEIDTITESFKLDILVLEHQNFMNSLYNKSDIILDESVLDEFKEKIKELIKRIKEAIHKLIAKLKEFLSRFVNENKIRIKAYNCDFKHLPDNYIFNNVYEYKESVAFANELKSKHDNIKKLIDKVIINTNYINGSEMEKAITDIQTEYDYYYENKDNVLPKIVNYSGKDAKKLFAKFEELNNIYFKLTYDNTSSLISYLKKADSKVDKLGDNFVKAINGKDVNMFSKHQDIQTYNYHSINANLQAFCNQYIQFFSLCCKMILMYKDIAGVIRLSYSNIVNKIIELCKND